MKEYKTSDLYFSAYLITAGCILQKTTKENNRVSFIFEHIVLIDELKLQYFNGEAKVKAQHYASQIKNLKSLTHQVMSSQQE